MFDELHFFVQLFKRSRSEPKMIRAIVEEENGQVEWVRQLGSIRHTPFRGLRVYPMLYECRARYGKRQGSWLIRTSANPPAYEWVWRDDFGYEDLPIAREYTIADQDAEPRGYWTEAAKIYGLILFGLMFTIIVYWLYF